MVIQIRFHSILIFFLLIYYLLWRKIADNVSSIKEVFAKQNLG